MKGTLVYPEKHLGHEVYASFNGLYILLRTPSGSEIALNSSVLASLAQYIEEFIAESNKGADNAS